QTEVNQYLEAIRQVFGLTESLEIKSCTLAEYYEDFVNHGTREIPKPTRSASILLTKTNPAQPLRKELVLPGSVVEAALDRYHVQPWFKYVFRERSSRWDIWQPCFWIATNIS